ncbi:MAG: PorP/SprF family type IX secretion system membrane protein [Cyclobacteriaceae bacterium]
MQILKRILVGLILCSATTSFAQQSDIYNQFYMNPYLYNPAYAGVEGHTVLYALYNQKWSGITDAPSMRHVSFHTPLKGGIGIGATAFNYVQGGLINNSAGKISASYLVSIDRKHHLRFGMSVGGGTQFLNFGELDDPTDPVFGNLALNNSFAIADFGATYHFDHFNVGFSIPNLVSYDALGPDGFSPIRVKPLDNLMIKINYRGHLSDDIAIEPHLIYRYSAFGPDQYEATAIFHIYHIVWLAATYRQDNNLAFSVGTKIKEMFGLGYAFELGNASLTNFLGPSHEVHIGYHLGTKKAHAEHVSSFIKSHRLTAEERAAKAAQEREERLLALQESRETPDDDALSIASQPEPEPEPENIDHWEMDQTHGDVVRSNEFNEQVKAVIIKHRNEEGEEEMAIAWVNADEDWELIETEEPLKRVSINGEREIGVKYYRTGPNGEKEMIVKWEPVLTPDQVDAILAGQNTTEALNEEEPIENQIVTTPQEVKEPVVTEPVITERAVETPVEQIEESAPEEEFTSMPDEQEPEQVPVQQEIDRELTDDTRTHEELTNSNEPLTVKRGNNMLELPAGNYVIVGAFDSYENAENLSDRIFEQGFHDTIVGYVSARKHYYVVVYRSDNVQNATREKNRLKNRSGFTDVWVLTVND